MGDGCDVVSGLGESTRHIWSGDVDLADGKLQEQHDAYMKHLEFIAQLKLRDSSELYSLSSDLKLTEDQLTTDLAFVRSGKLIIACITTCMRLFYNAALQEAQSAYEEKHQSGTTDKVLTTLAWKVKELEDLQKQGRGLVIEVDSLTTRLSDGSCDLIQENIARRLTSLRKELSSFVQGLSRYQRTAATHIFVFMISPEGRKRKPYAIPVQCLPYKGMKEKECISLVNRLVQEMNKRNMKGAGIVPYLFFWNCL